MNPTNTYYSLTSDEAHRINLQGSRQHEGREVCDVTLLRDRITGQQQIGNIALAPSPRMEVIGNGILRLDDIRAIAQSHFGGLLTGYFSTSRAALCQFMPTEDATL